MRKSPLRGRPKPKEYDLELAELWWTVVLRRDQACAVCGSKQQLQAHHIIDKQFIEDFAREERLTNAERNALLWEEDNGLTLCQRCHTRHTDAFKRVPRRVIPERAYRFARMLGAMAHSPTRGSGWALSRLEKTYPSEVE